MRKKARWIAAGLAAALCATASLGAAALAEEQSESVEAVEEETPAETEAPEEEADQTEAPKEEAAEAEASDEEEAAEAETETEKSSKKKKKKKNKETEEEETETETEAEVEYVSVSFENEDVWEELTIPNSDLVESAVNIHSEADEDGDIIGYLYSGAAAWIIEAQDDWTEIYSNGLTGYVLSEYLLTGDEVAGIADYYGIEGVRAEWDGVIVYATDEAADELGVMNAGDVYPVVNYGEHWDEIQYEEETVAYVSQDDVSNVLIFAPATPKEGERTELEEVYEGSEGNTEEYAEEDTDEGYYEEYEEDYYEDDYYEDYYEDDYYDSSYDSSADYYYEEPSYSETYTEPSYTEPSYNYSGSSSVSAGSGSGDAGTTYETQAETQPATQAETQPATQAETQAATEAPVDDGTTSSSDNIGGAYYDANTDTYYDDDGNVVASYYYSEDDYTTYSSDNYAEEAYWEETYEEEVSYGSTAGSDDTSLLAALIYCEAGNQPYEGMVAVGAVVMNRVYSGSFPNSISEVIYQSGQFTPASSGALASALASGVGDTYYAAAADALAGTDPTGGALYFNTSHGSGVQIGDHWFY